jgi:hypothetical protein
MLVRASFFKDVGNMTEIDTDRAGAARVLFAALRPSVKREIRKERIGDVFLFAEYTDARMEELVDLVGGDPDTVPRGGIRRGFWDDAEPLVFVDSEPYPDSDSDSDDSSVVTVSYDGAFASDPRGSIRAYVAMYMDVSDELGWRGDVIASYGPMSFWRTSAVTRLSYLFCWRAYVNDAHVLDADDHSVDYFDTVRLFSANLYWDTRNVTHMDGAFAGGRFDGALNHLNVSRVTTFQDAFRDAEDFRGPLDLWRPRREPDTTDMFTRAAPYRPSRVQPMLTDASRVDDIVPSLWWYGPRELRLERRERAENMQRRRWERYLSRGAD